MITLKEVDNQINIGDVFDVTVGNGGATLYLPHHMANAREGIVDMSWVGHAWVVTSFASRGMDTMASPILT